MIELYYNFFYKNNLILHLLLMKLFMNESSLRFKKDLKFSI